MTHVGVGGPPPIAPARKLHRRPPNLARAWPAQSYARSPASPKAVHTQSTEPAREVEPHVSHARAPPKEPARSHQGIHCSWSGRARRPAKRQSVRAPNATVAKRTAENWPKRPSAVAHRCSSGITRSKVVVDANKTYPLPERQRDACPSTAEIVTSKISARYDIHERPAPAAGRRRMPDHSRSP